MEQPSRDGGSQLKNNINVTPLADVMLVLLIIFMVITPMLNQGVEVRVPEAENPTKHPDNEKTLVLSLKGDGTVFLNRDEIPAKELLPKLRKVFAERTDKILYIKANEVLDYGYVLEMMETCREAGALEVALITREKKASGGTPL